MIASIPRLRPGCVVLLDDGRKAFYTGLRNGLMHVRMPCKRTGKWKVKDEPVPRASVVKVVR